MNANSAMNGNKTYVHRLQILAKDTVWWHPNYGLLVLGVKGYCTFMWETEAGTSHCYVEPAYAKQVLYARGYEFLGLL